MTTKFRRVARWDRHAIPGPEIGRMIRITHTAPFRTVGVDDPGDACIVVSTYEQAGDLYVVTSIEARND